MEKFFILKNKPILKIILFILSGSCMIGQGLRMIYQGLFYQNSTYTPVIFDIFFDWITLSVLGIALFLYGITKYYDYYSTTHMQIQKQGKKDSPLNYPT